MSRSMTAALAVLVLVLGVGVGIGVGLLVQDRSSQVAAATASPDATPGSSFEPADPEPTATGEAPAETPSASVQPSPSIAPSPTPEPTPVIVEPLTGLPVSEKAAKRRVIAVMIDDLWAARPQSGLSGAGVVWHAPAEGGIPRYMALFGAGNPTSVGPIRSSRLYYIAWASEWTSAYVHVGGSPQAMAYLATNNGRGKAVYNADYNRWGNSSYLWRITSRYAPHNVYSDAKALRRLANAVGADPYEKVPEPVWRFAADAPLEARPAGGTIVVPYPANKVSYKYARKSNTYLRSVSVEGTQVDAADDTRIAPKNVVVMQVPFISLGVKGRLDGKVNGTGKAWIFTNGKVIKGTWKKAGFTEPTRFFGPDGKPVTLTAGQTFIQVIPKSMSFTFTKGKVPPATSPSPSPSAEP